MTAQEKHPEPEVPSLHSSSSHIASHTAPLTVLFPVCSAADKKFLNRISRTWDKNHLLASPLSARRHTQPYCLKGQKHHQGHCSHPTFQLLHSNRRYRSINLNTTCSKQRHVTTSLNSHTYTVVLNVFISNFYYLYTYCMHHGGAATLILLCFKYNGHKGILCSALQKNYKWLRGFSWQTIRHFSFQMFNFAPPFVPLVLSVIM